MTSIPEVVFQACLVSSVDVDSVKTIVYVQPKVHQ